MATNFRRAARLNEAASEFIDMENIFLLFKYTKEVSTYNKMVRKIERAYKAELLKKLESDSLTKIKFTHLELLGVYSDRLGFFVKAEVQYTFELEKKKYKSPKTVNIYPINI